LRRSDTLTINLVFGPRALPGRCSILSREDGLSHRRAAHLEGATHPPADHVRHWLGQTLLPAAALDPSGRAGPAERQPCRTAGARFAGARFTAARARDHARPRAWSAAVEQTGNMGTFRGKPRRNARACVPQYLRSAICATQFKALCHLSTPLRRSTIERFSRARGSSLIFDHSPRRCSPSLPPRPTGRASRSPPLRSDGRARSAGSPEIIATAYENGYPTALLVALP
jgi:hypothetical protein